MAELYLSSDAPDTDLIVRITDVDESGRSIKLADGLLDIKYRDGFDHEAFMAPGEVYCVRIRTTKISCKFPRGHRLRFTITSSANNLIFPNSNTKEGFASSEYRIAHNTIHHSEEYPSCVLLRIER